MAKKRFVTPSNDLPVFAAVELSGDDYENFDVWLKEEKPDLEDSLVLMLEEGYKISFRYEAEDDFYTCFCTMSAENRHHNANISTGSAGDSAAEALFFNVFKIYVLWEGKRLPVSGGRKRRG